MIQYVVKIEKQKILLIFLPGQKRKIWGLFFLPWNRKERNLNVYSKLYKSIIENRSQNNDKLNREGQIKWSIVTQVRMWNFLGKISKFRISNPENRLCDLRDVIYKSCDREGRPMRGKSSVANLCKWEEITLSLSNGHRESPLKWEINEHGWN